MVKYGAKDGQNLSPATDNLNSGQTVGWRGRVPLVAGIEQFVDGILNYWKESLNSDRWEPLR